MDIPINCVFNGNEYKNLSQDTVAGIFIASEIDLNQYPAVLANNGQGKFKVITSLKPKSKFAFIESNPALDFFNEFKNLISNYKILILSKPKFFLLSNEDILKGISIYFSSLDKYPDIKIFKFTDKWKESSIYFDVINNGKNDFVSPQIIKINLKIPTNNGQWENKKILVDSMDPRGWQRKELFERIHEGLISFSKTKGLKIDENMVCIKLISLGNGKYDPIFSSIR